MADVFSFVDTRSTKLERHHWNHDYPATKRQTNMGKIYGTINVKEVHSKGVRGCEEHNRRQYQTDKMPKNIDLSRSHLNQEWIAGGKANFNEAIQEKLDGVTVRKNAVIALEYVLGASPEFFKGMEIIQGYLDHCTEFVKQRHGTENIIAVNVHLDEMTPHVHVLAVPLVKKKVKWKNKKGAGEKIENRLCARDFTGHPNMLRQLQNDFYEHIIPVGELTGREFTRYTSAQEQVKTYNSRVDYRIAEINKLAEIASQQMISLERDLEQNRKMLHQHELELEEKIKLLREQKLNLERQIEINQQIVREKERLDKELKEKREAEKRVAQLKKINKDKDIDDNKRQQGRGLW